MRELLNTKQADALDLLQLFELLFFEPYQQWANFTLYNMAPDIAIGALEQCFTRIDWSQHTLCEYGRLGQLLASWQEPESIDALIQLAEKFPRSSLYQAIGTFFLKKQKPDRAREFFIKALVISGDNDHTQRIRSLIVNTK
jgi:hypothetical protein